MILHVAPESLRYNPLEQFPRYIQQDGFVAVGTGGNLPRLNPENPAGL